MVRNSCHTHYKQPETYIFARGVTTATKALRNIETVKQKQTAFRGGMGGGPDPSAEKTKNSKKNSH